MSYDWYTGIAERKAHRAAILVGIGIAALGIAIGFGAGWFFAPSRNKQYEQFPSETWWSARDSVVSRMYAEEYARKWAREDQAELDELRSDSIRYGGHRNADNVRRLKAWRDACRKHIAPETFEYIEAAIEGDCK